MFNQLTPYFNVSSAEKWLVSFLLLQIKTDPNTFFEVMDVKEAKKAISNIQLKENDWKCEIEVASIHIVSADVFIKWAQKSHGSSFC